MVAERLALRVPMDSVGATARPSLLSEGSTGRTAAESRIRNQRKRPRQPKPDNILTVPGVVTRRRCQRLVVAITAAVAAAMLPRGAEAQYNADTPLFEENMEKAEAELIASLKGGDYAEEAFFPERQVSIALYTGLVLPPPYQSGAQPIGCVVQDHDTNQFVY